MKVTKLEEKIIQFMENHLEIFVFLALTILGCLIRYFPRQFVSADADDCLLHWYSTFANNGGIHLLKYQVGNYSIPYQEFLACVVYIPFNNALFEIKIFSILFDFSLATAAGCIVYEMNHSVHRKIMAVLSYGVVLCLPTVFLNSALWGQCDAIYSSFLLWTVYFLVKEKYITSFIMYGLAFAFKLQALFLLPFLLWYWLVKRKYSLLNFIIVPITMITVCLPAIFMGRNIAEVFTVYGDQIGNSERIFENYPCFLNLLSPVSVPWMLKELTGSMILLTVVVLLVLMVFAYLYRERMDWVDCILVAFITFYTIDMFVPCIHDRYAFFIEILIVALSFLDVKLIPIGIAMQCLMVHVYGVTLNDATTTHYSVLAAINMMIYCTSIAYTMYRIVNKKIETNEG